VWLVGLLALVAGSVLQSVGLAYGGLTIVEPLLIASLPIALAVRAVVYAEKVPRAQWLGAAGVCAGLVGFIVVASPTQSDGTGSDWLWLVAGGTAGAIVAALTLLAWPARHSRRALALATASGIAWGLSDALSKAAFSIAQRHALGLLTAWQTYAFLGVAVIALIQSQLAFNAAPLRVSLPCLALGEPLVGLFLGVGVLSDRLRHSPWALAIESVCGAAMIAAAIPLARAHAGARPGRPFATGGGRTRGKFESEHRGDRRHDLGRHEPDVPARPERAELS
jgi:drug/metabolite transporter (DMT)-like permease